MREAHLEVLVEEPSAEAALTLLLPKCGIGSFSIHAFQGKLDLLRKLPGRLKGYKWLPPTHRLLVLVDRDDDNCLKLKAALEHHAHGAGLVTRSTAPAKRWVVVNRIAVEELEAWFFGDWEAVRAAYPRLPATIPARQEYRDPDAIRGGTWERFEEVLQASGYYPSGLQKSDVARRVAEHMVPPRNTSASFRCLREALEEISTGSV
jgi:hypothetical protein